MQPASISEALLRYGGMYGSAWRLDPVSGAYQMLAEVVTVTAEVQINRIEVPIVGSTRNGHKPGRETREGTISIQKIDAKWESEIYSFLSAGLEQRRALRDSASATNPKRTFDLQLRYDDPDALGLEEWVLYDCALWSMSLGFSITDDTVERQYPLTWEREAPVHTFVAQRAGTVVNPNWLVGGYTATGGAPPRDF